MRKSNRNRVVSVVAAFGLLAVVSATARLAHAAPPPNPPGTTRPADTSTAKRSPLLAAMQLELDRSLKVLSAQDPPAYYIGYTITDTNRVNVSGSNGALLSSDENRSRYLEVSVRTGSYDLDNTHKVGTRQEQRGGAGSACADRRRYGSAAARDLARDRQAIRSAAEALIKIKTGKEVKVETAEGAAPDFTHEQPHTDIGPEVSIKVDRTPWEAKVRAYTKEFRSSPAVINSIVTFTAQAQNAYQITSEGHAAAVRADSLPPGIVHPGQGAGRDGPRALLQL